MDRQVKLSAILLEFAFSVVGIYGALNETQIDRYLRYHSLDFFSFQISQNLLFQMLLP